MPERPYLRPGVAGGSKTREREHLVMRLRDMININNCLKNSGFRIRIFLRIRIRTGQKHADL